MPAGHIDPALAEQIAAATRLLVMEDILGYSGHVSSRQEGTDHILIQGATDSRAALEPGQVLLVDRDGKVVEGASKPPLEVALHLEIYRARPDVNAILHCHLELAMAFTLMKDTPLVPMVDAAARWHSGIPIHPDSSLIKSREQARALAETLGDAHAALLRAHGLVLTAESVPALLVDAVHFQENARMQMMVVQSGREPLPLTAEEIKAHNVDRNFHVPKLWDYYTRLGRSRGVVPGDWNRL